MVWMQLVALNLAAFLLTLPFAETAFKYLAFVPANALQMPWTIVTSMFLHASPLHLFFNMWALFIFGPVLERVVGGKRFLSLYFIAGIVGNVGFALFYPSATAGVGASGAIYGIIGALAVLLPNLVVLVFFLPMPMWMAAIAWAAFEFFSSLSPSPIANLVHLTGLAAGIILGIRLRKEAANELAFLR